MADYNLSGLSTRSFEQLIQAIAAKVIGPGTVIFGDGPDGGREATFEGSISYPDKDNAWQGYGVVQAKFRQRPQGPKKDGEWALKQLRSELEKFVDPERNLRKPEYYIFATNVVLTPVQDLGSKDKVYALIEEFKEHLPLKGYDVWDYDKICTFLDGYEDIRRGYAAWITPGDVLAQVIEQLEPRQPDFEQIVTNFLQKELVADQYANLEQAGHAMEDRIPLAHVFVDLPTFDERRLDPPDEEPEDLPTGFIAKVLDVAAERLDPESLRAYAGYQSAVQEASRPEPGRFVLIGGPGQGKTTIGQFMCQLFRAAILKKRPQHSFAPEVSQALGLIEDQCCSAGIQLPLAPRFPILITLSDFAAKLASREANHVNSLLSYIVDRIQKRTGGEVSVDDFRQWLEGYPWIIILDGLDEVPASSNRDEVLAAVRDFWIDATDCNADVLVVATTRPQGYNEDYAPDLYQHKWLAPLSTARAMHYGRRLAEVRYGNDPDRCEKVITRLQRASDHEATARLMRSPLQVTIMTTLVDRMGQPPQERWNLFNEYYNVIYQREMERDILAATVLRQYKPDIDTIHNRVGLLLQIESDRSGRTDAHLSSDCLAALVEARLIEEGHRGEELNGLKQRIIEAAAHRLVFLVGLEADAVGFEIRPLQEFMAAEGLMEGGDEDVRKRLKGIAPIVNWRNVFLFAAGKCFAERQYLRDTIHAICAELNEDKDEVARATLAGSQLALDLLEDGPARRQPKYAQMLTRLALRLLDLPPYNDHVRLADLYDSALEHVYREELEHRLAQENTVSYLGAWTALIPLIEAKVPWAENLGNTHWPSDESKQLQLLQVAANSRPGSWSFGMLVNVLPTSSVPPLNLENLFDKLYTSHARDLSEPLWLSALQHATALHRRPPSIRTVPLCLPGIEEEPFQVDLSLINAEYSSWLIPLKDLPDPGFYWIPFVAAARFLENPSNATLARELRAIAKNFAPQWARGVACRVPWPMGACLSMSSNQDELREMANRAEAGEFGDIEDWRAAEKRWLTHGVVAEDIDSMTDERWPFDKDIAQLGFPFSVALSFSIAVVPEREALVTSLLNIHARCGKSYIRSVIAYWTLFVLGTFDEVKIISERITYSQFRAMVQDVAKDSINMDALNALTWEDTIDQQWGDFFDYLGKQEKCHGPYRSMNKLSKLLSDAFCEHPARIGILRVLSLLAIGGACPSVPAHLLDPGRYDDPMFREAAIIVRLAQGDWSQDEAKSLAKYTVELVNDRPEIGDRVLKTISEHQITGSFADQFLLELRKRLPAAEWEMINRTIRALKDPLSRRTSRLADPRVWSELGLPKGLNDLIRE